jgi:type IV secretory pathway VirB10-like protein
MSEEPRDDISGLDELRPSVAARKSPGRLWLSLGGAVLLGVGAFTMLSAQRASRPAPTVSSGSARTTDVSALAPPKELSLVEDAARGAPVLTPQAQKPAAPLPSLTPPPPLLPAAPAIDFAGQAASLERLKTPSVIVDFSAPATAAAGPAGSAGSAKDGSTKDAGGKGLPANGPRLNADEQFADRVGAAEPDHAQASQLHNRSTLAPQGTIISAVLETALDSDLPGFARAVVSLDVRGFDGSQVLIPRGSRLIGQYRSGVSQGQSRAFVIWTRLIRPDGVSIQIGSPASDTLGRAGLEGRVDRHFIERFGGSILLSVINAGVASAVRGPSTQVLIGSSQDAAGLAAAISPPTSIPPTIKVAQGAPVRVFVARDLDFSTAPSGDPRFQ